jgi:hypothetical protein
MAATVPSVSKKKWYSWLQKKTTGSVRIKLTQFYNFLILPSDPKVFLSSGHDSGNECRWAAAYLARIYMKIKNMFFTTSLRRLHY